MNQSPVKIDASLCVCRVADKVWRMKLKMPIPTLFSSLTLGVNVKEKVYQGR